MPFGFGFNYNLNDVFQGLFAKTIMDFRFGNTGNGFWGCNYTNMNSCWGNGFAQMGWGDTFAAGSAGGSSSSTVEGEEERLKEQEEKNKIKNERDSYVALLKAYNETLSDKTHIQAVINVHGKGTVTEEHLAALKEEYEKCKDKIEENVKNGEYDAEALAAYYNLKGTVSSATVKINAAKAKQDAAKVNVGALDAKYRKKTDAAAAVLASLANMDPLPEAKTKTDSKGNMYKQFNLENGQNVIVYYDKKGEISKVSVSIGQKGTSNKSEVQFAADKLNVRESLDSSDYDYKDKPSDYEFNTVKSLAGKFASLDADKKSKLSEIAITGCNDWTDKDKVEEACKKANQVLVSMLHGNVNVSGPTNNKYIIKMDGKSVYVDVSGSDNKIMGISVDYDGNMADVRYEAGKILLRENNTGNYNKHTANSDKGSVYPMDKIKALVIDIIKSKVPDAKIS